MSAQIPDGSLNSSMEVKPEDVRGRWVTGVALMVIGLVALLANLIDSPSLGMLIVPTLGLVFTLWGLIVRQVGLLIPGGILSGIGLGLYLTEGPFSAFTGEAEAGVFLLAFAAGWGLITLLSTFVERTHWWPLIPGGILALIGGALLQGGLALEILAWVGRFWPVGLIAFGLYLLLRRK